MSNNSRKKTFLYEVVLQNEVTLFDGTFLGIKQGGSEIFQIFTEKMVGYPEPGPNETASQQWRWLCDIARLALEPAHLPAQ